MPDAYVNQWEARLERVRQEWEPLRRQHPPWSAQDAQDRFDELRGQRHDLTARGLWLGGPRNALQVLGLHTDEATATRVLAWLARPDGHHRLHETTLRLLFELARVDPGPRLEQVRVALEDSRETVDRGPEDPLLTRADLVVYTRQATLVVEAKLFALEQHNQLDRLRACWNGDPNPAFLFITRTTTTQTSSNRGGTWPTATWAHIAHRLRAAAFEQPTCSPTAHAFIDALEDIA